MILARRWRIGLSGFRCPEMLGQSYFPAQTFYSMAKTLEKLDQLCFLMIDVCDLPCIDVGGSRRTTASFEPSSNMTQIEFQRRRWSTDA